MAFENLEKLDFPVVEVEEDRLVELEGSFAGEARRPVKNKGYQHSHENSDS